MIDNKCVIAAGGLGTRLTNFRNSGTTKMLLEVNGVPMINRQIQQMIQWGMDDFVIITNPEFDSLTKEITTKNFSDINLNFVIQNEPLGISHALLQAEPYIESTERVVFILGDNFFEFDPLHGKNILNIENKIGSYIFTYEVQNPSDFGVAILDDQGKVISIEEKPENPKSNKAIVGLYVYDDTVIEKIKRLTPSSRGEYEITDLNNLYIKECLCKSIYINGWWIDAVTPERIEELETKLI